MAPNIRWNGDQCCFNKFDCKWFIPMFSQFAFHLSLSLSVISKSRANLAACVAIYQLATCWMCNSPRMGCVWRITPMYTWRKQAEIKSAQCGITNVACCHSVKLCALAARLFQSQQSDAVTRMWRWWEVQPSQKECAIGAVHCVGFPWFGNQCSVSRRRNLCWGLGCCPA